jgi:hypothetical protein
MKNVRENIQSRFMFINFDCNKVFGNKIKYLIHTNVYGRVLRVMNVRLDIHIKDPSKTQLNNAYKVLETL